MIPDPIQQHDAHEADRLDADDTHWCAMHPTADEIRTRHGWPRHVYVSEEAEALRLQYEAMLMKRRRIC